MPPTPQTWHLVQTLLRLTDFRNPLLRTLVPSVAASFAIQAAFAVPSILGRSDRFYDFSGSVTFLSVTALSLYLPALRARVAAGGGGFGTGDSVRRLLAEPFLQALGSGNRVGMGSDGNLKVPVYNWRQVALSLAVGVWAVRCSLSLFFLLSLHLVTLLEIQGGLGILPPLLPPPIPPYPLQRNVECQLTDEKTVGSYLFKRVLHAGSDSRFDEIKKSPAKFLGAFAAQATWVSLSLLPVIAVNALPNMAAAAAAHRALAGVTVTDLAGVALYAGGLLFEVVADRQKARWARDKEDKVHDEQFLTRGLWSRRFVFVPPIPYPIPSLPS